MKLSVNRLALFALVAALAVPAEAHAQAAARRTAKTTFKDKDSPFAGVPVTGTGTVSSTGQQGIFRGTIDIIEFFQGTAMGTDGLPKPAIKARAILNGALTNAGGAVLSQVFNQFVAFDLVYGGGTCPILNLELGPLHLDLLGLVIDLNEVVLNIVAQAGAGNLLGNLLCGLLGLLDPLVILAQIGDIIAGLNRLVMLLGI